MPRGMPLANAAKVTIINAFVIGYQAAPEPNDAFRHLPSPSQLKNRRLHRKGDATAIHEYKLNSAQINVYIYIDICV